MISSSFIRKTFFFLASFFPYRDVTWTRNPIWDCKSGLTYRLKRKWFWQSILSLLLIFNCVGPAELWVSQLAQWWRIHLPMQETQETLVVLFLGQEDALEEEMATHCSIPCLENPTDRAAWWSTVHGVTKSQTWLSMRARQSYINNSTYRLGVN